MGLLIMTAGELAQAAPVLAQLRERRLYSVKGAYALARILKAAEPELQILEGRRVALCEQFAAKDDEGKPKMREGGSGFDIADVTGFDTGWKATLSHTVELSGVRALLPDELDAAEKPTAQELFLLGPLVAEPDDAAQS